MLTLTYSKKKKKLYSIIFPIGYPNGFKRLWYDLNKQNTRYDATADSTLLFNHMT